MIKKFKHSFSIGMVIALFLLVTRLSATVFAGGGRFRLESFSSPGSTGSDGIHVQAWLLTSGQGFASVGEHAEFRIQNPRKEDRCETTTNITTNNGLIFGICSTTQAGQMLVYVHSFDTNEDSSPIVIYFYDRPTLNPMPTRIPNQNPTLKPTLMEVIPTMQQTTINPTATSRKGDIFSTPTSSLLIRKDTTTVQSRIESFFGRVVVFINKILLKLTE